MSCMFCTGLFTAFKTNQKESSTTQDSTPPALPISTTPIIVPESVKSPVLLDMNLTQTSAKPNKPVDSAAEILFSLAKDKNSTKQNSNPNLNAFFCKLQSKLFGSIRRNTWQIDRSLTLNSNTSQSLYYKDWFVKISIFFALFSKPHTAISILTAFYSFWFHIIALLFWVNSYERVFFIILNIDSSLFFQMSYMSDSSMKLKAF